MNKKIGLIVAVVVIVLGFLLSGLLSNQKKEMFKKPAAPAVSNYRFQTISNQKETLNIILSGTVNSFHAVDLFAEVTGVARSGKTEFREGARFKKGDVLLKIDDTEYKNSVYSQKSGFVNNLTALIPDLKMDYPKSAQKWENYLNDFEIESALAPLPEVTNEKEKYFITTKNIYSQYYTIKSLEAKLNKFTIIAPFDGIVAETSIKPGTLIRASQAIGTFKNTDILELTAFAGVEEVQMLEVGMPVTLISDDISGEFKGKISRINKTIERTSQKVKVYILIKDSRLIDGAYLKAGVTVTTIQPVAKIPSEAVYNAGTVWTNQKGKFVSKPIQIIDRLDKYLLVAGLENGEKVLLNPDKNVWEGKEIAFNNSQKKGK
jgi:RND family efflux transporter MFP subunit